MIVQNDVCVSFRIKCYSRLKEETSSVLILNLFLCVCVRIHAGFSLSRRFKCSSNKKKEKRKDVCLEEILNRISAVMKSNTPEHNIVTHPDFAKDNNQEHSRLYKLHVVLATLGIHI